MKFIYILLAFGYFILWRINIAYKNNKINLLNEFEDLEVCDTKGNPDKLDIEMREEADFVLIPEDSQVINVVVECGEIVERTFKEPKGEFFTIRGN